MKSCEQKIRQNADGDSVGDKLGVRPRAPRKAAAQSPAPAYFSEKPQADGGEGDTHLHAGNNAFEMRDEILHDARVGISTFYQLAHAGKAHGDQRKLRRGEKRVDANQRQDAEQADEDHGAILSVWLAQPRWRSLGEKAANARWTIPSRHACRRAPGAIDFFRTGLSRDMRGPNRQTGRESIFHAVIL